MFSRSLSRPGARSSLPHLRRLRRREDVGLGGIAAFGTVLAALFVSTMARAEPVRVVRVQEQPSLDVVVTIEGSRAPTFQVFRLPGQDAFAIELPGADLTRAKTELGGDGVLLERASVEAQARNAPRVIVRFHGDVDYDAKSQGSTLVVTFSSLGDKGALRQAWSERRSETDARSNARQELAATTQKLEEQRRAYLAMVKDFEERQAKEKAALAAVEERVKQARAGLANLEQRHGDEEKRLATLVKQREDAAAAVQRISEETRRADEQRQRAIAAVKATEADLKRAQEELAKAKDKRALEEAKTELARLKQELAGVVEKRAAEERRVAEARAGLEQAKKDLAALKDEQQKEQLALATMKERTRAEEARTRAEEKRAAAASEQSKRVEQLLASLKEQQGFEQRRLDDMRAEVRRAAEEAAAIGQRTARERAELTALERSVAEQRQALAQLGQQRQQLEARLASLAQQTKDAESRAHAALARADAPRPRGAPAPQPRAAPRQGRIEMASAEPAAVYGFGGRSVDLASSSGPNHYEQTDGYDDYSDGAGLLSHVTVQRGQGAASRVGVRVDGGARYAVERVGQRQVVLTLFGTRAANLDVRRILDARDLGTTVLRVLPRVHEGGENRIELTIELRDPVPIRVAQDDAMLWLHVGS